MSRPVSASVACAITHPQLGKRLMLRKRPKPLNSAMPPPLWVGNRNIRNENGVPGVCRRMAALAFVQRRRWPALSERCLGVRSQRFAGRSERQGATVRCPRRQECALSPNAQRPPRPPAQVRSSRTLVAIAQIDGMPTRRGSVSPNRPSGYDYENEIRRRYTGRLA